MSPRPVFLSKSKLIAARQCLKRLYLEIHRPDLKEISAKTEAAFETGHRVGAIARDIYGTDDADFVPFEGGLGHALKKTARLMKAGPASPIFEATFQHGGVLVRVDVLLPDGDGWRIVEVKASTSVKEEHVFDCAVQAWVFAGQGHRLTRTAVAHVDNSFVYEGDGDYDGLLVEVDQTRHIEKLLPAVPDWIRRAGECSRGDDPEIGVGSHCYEPYPCPFIRHCWPAGDGYPVQGLGGNKAKLGQFIEKGYLDIRDVPAELLTAKQRHIQRVTRNGKAELLEEARHFVHELGYPRYYLDFETAMPAIPVWAGTRPYESLPIQWSCHYEEAPGQLSHCDFLDLTGEAPMRRLAESLIRALGNDGPVLMYTSYERTVIRNLIRRFPDLDKPLSAIIERLVDLKPATEEFYYHPDMAGSWSLKSVLPTVANEMSYDKLEGIQEGTAASEGYLEAIDPATSVARKDELREQLLRYCKFDTEGMVRLLHFLEDR